MSSKTKIILIVTGILLIILGVLFLAYRTGSKAAYGPEGAPTPAPDKDEIVVAPKMNRFSLGEFVAPASEEDLHYIKIEVEVGFIGELEKELEERKAELRDAITSTLMKLNVARAKEDYIDRFLHKDIEKQLNHILGRTTSESRILAVFIPVFLIN